MSQRREQTDATSRRHMPAIHGVRARDTFADRATAFDPEQIAADQLAEQEEDGASAATIDPWGVEDVSAPIVEDSAPPAPTLPRRGGGTLTIPLLCIGIAIIACVSLLPLADENRQLAWERERLKADH